MPRPGRHGAPKTAKVLRVRPLTKEEYENFQQGTAAIPQLKKIRDSHHMIARLVAMGIKRKDIAKRCGYTPVYITHLQRSPAFQDLVAHYRNMVDEEYATKAEGYFETITQAREMSARMILDHLAEADESGEPIPLRQLTGLHADLADRTGFGKRLDIHHNHDFADLLDRAISRSNKAKVIDQVESAEALSSPSTRQIPEGLDDIPSLAPPTNPAHRLVAIPSAEVGVEVGEPTSIGGLEPNGAGLELTAPVNEQPGVEPAPPPPTRIRRFA